jgi:hypothetical protein
MGKGKGNTRSFISQMRRGYNSSGTFFSVIPEVEQHLFHKRLLLFGDPASTTTLMGLQIDINLQKNGFPITAFGNDNKRHLFISPPRNRG